MNFRSVLMLLHTMLWTIIGVTVMILDPTAHLYMYLARVGWAPQVLWLGGVELTVKGLENLERDRPHILVANHASQLDIPLLFAALPIPIRFLAKRSLFYIPIFGWSLALARFVPVDRGSSRKARRSIDRAARRVRRGRSLVIFPEGTRSADGAIKKFKSGAFVMGVKSGVPILPLAIRGSFEVVPKSTLAVTPGPIELVIGEPIPTDGLAMEDKEPLRKRTEAVVRQMFETGEPV
jgi:1-acyl-sn-glycerol-3-phosphate acyltransferase